MNILQTVLDFLYPPHCPACEKYVENTGDWCDSCLEKTFNFHILPIAAGNYGVLCQIYALGHYHGALQNLITRLKYKNDMNALKCIHNFINKMAGQIKLPADIEVVIAVPLHKKRYEQRGFNQTELIFAKLLQKANLNYSACMKRCAVTMPQFELSREERLKNVKNAFQLQAGITIKNKNCLLLDDIFTTGATMMECAKVLQKNGAGKIYGMVLASDA